MSRGVLRLVTAVFVMLAAVMTMSGVVDAHPRVVFAEWTTDAAVMHNRIAGFIARHGYGYDVDYMLVDAVAGVQGMRRGVIDVSMLTWVDNSPELWHPAIESGEFIDLGNNFPDAPQGFYVPAYVIKGDPDRGIKPLAPDLATVFDLPKYWELFRDPEIRNKGRLYNGPTGWNSSEQVVMKLTSYGLDETYANFYPGSQAALDASIVRAFQRGEPWLGYYWEPTWVMGQYDMIRLEEPAHDASCWNEAAGYACAFPAVDVRILATPKFVKSHPELARFLRNYETRLEHTNNALAYMETQGLEPQDAAMWFLRTYDELWSSWMDHASADKVRAALQPR